MDIKVGSAVYSLSGRDKGKMYLVSRIENGYCFLTDGDKRRIENPKKKKEKHLNRTNFVSSVFEAETVENHMIRKELNKLRPI